VPTSERLSGNTVFACHSEESGRRRTTKNLIFTGSAEILRGVCPEPVEGLRMTLSSFRMETFESQFLAKRPKNSLPNGQMMNCRKERTRCVGINLYRRLNIVHLFPRTASPYRQIFSVETASKYRDVIYSERDRFTHLSKISISIEVAVWPSHELIQTCTNLPALQFRPSWTKLDSVFSQFIGSTPKDIATIFDRYT